MSESIHKAGFSSRAGKYWRGNVVLHIAARDLWHEFLLSLCLILSVTAILTPILLLASVKVGFIDRLRMEFIEDPSFREIRPGSADLRSESVFEDIRNWPGVSYAIPTVMMNPREVAVRIRKTDGIFRGEATLLPSTDEDPFLGRLQGDPPSGDNVVVTADFAEAAGIGIGDAFTIVVTRIENDQRKRVQIDAVVNGLIPADVLPSQTILGTPELEQHVEFYRSGVSVPERGWLGIDMEPRQAFSFIFGASPEPVGETLKSNLAVRIGAREARRIGPAELPSIIGVPAGTRFNSPVGDLLMLVPGGRMYTGRDLIEANDVLRNSEAFAFGAHPARDVEMLGRNIRMFGLPESLQIPETAGDVENARSRGASLSLNDRVLLPESLKDQFNANGRPDRIDVQVGYDDGEPTKELLLSLRPSGFIQGDSAMVSSALMALLERGRQVPLRFDKSSNGIVEQSTGFRGFRIIGSSIDLIPALAERLEASGVKVRAKSSQILKLQRLERSLNILVFVVAFVALIGGFSILTSSFFANVQRKKVAYATMRLIGMPKRLVFRIPIAQACIIASLGFLASVACYVLISSILNSFIAAELDFDGQLSRLYFSHFVLAGLFVVASACVASLAASRAATSIDPADALRTD
ncbi:MAG: hypothetical protein OXC26_25235 [Albidovulum sp.]|nr:hypothetical protein [Albidovulum sp.]